MMAEYMNENNKTVIMVVDDEEDTVVFTQMILQSLNYQVICAEDGKTALELAHKNRPDLILLDINMPVMDGFEIIKILRQDDILKDIPVIVHTNRVNRDPVLKFTQLADDIICKPAKSYEYNYKIKKILNSNKNKQNKQKPNILLAISDREVSKQIIPAIEELGFDIMNAKNGLEALFLFKRYVTHMALLDINIPIIAGMALAREINEISPGTPIVLFNDSDNEPDNDPDEKPKTEINRGIKQEFTKPVDLESLKEYLSNYFEK